MKAPPPETALFPSPPRHVDGLSRKPRAEYAVLERDLFFLVFFWDNQSCEVGGVKDVLSNIKNCVL